MRENTEIDKSSTLSLRPFSESVLSCFSRIAVPFEIILLKTFVFSHTHICMMKGERTILLYKNISQHLLRFIPGPFIHCLFCFWPLFLLMYVALIPSFNWLPGILSCGEAMFSFSFTSCCIFILFPIFHHSKQFRRHHSRPGSHQARAGEFLSRHVS